MPKIKENLELQSDSGNEKVEIDTGWGAKVGKVCSAIKKAAYLLLSGVLVAPSGGCQTAPEVKPNDDDAGSQHGARSHEVAPEPELEPGTLSSLIAELCMELGLADDKEMALSYAGYLLSRADFTDELMGSVAQDQDLRIQLICANRAKIGALINKFCSAGQFPGSSKAICDRSGGGSPTRIRAFLNAAEIYIASSGAPTGCKVTGVEDGHNDEYACRLMEVRCGE
jgi:hypothetical protein